MLLNNTGTRSISSLDDHMIPLINIVFLMLIFFMIAGQILPTEIFRLNTLRLDQANDLHIRESTLLINQEGRLAWNQQEISLEDLKELLVSTPLPALTIKADSRLAANTFITILDQLSRSGINDFIIIASQENSR